MSMKEITVVTTFHKPGLDLYAQNFLNSFHRYVDKRVKMIAYAEDCDPIVYDNSQIKIFDHHARLPKLVKFKDTWKNIPKANGDVTDDPIRSRRKDSGKGFKWHAIRFANKVYAVLDAARTCNSDILIWMDADSIVHTKMPLEFYEDFIPDDVFLSYAGRKGKYTECGWYSMNLRHPYADEFFNEFERMYNDAENGIFQLDEWHDSFVFDVVRKWHEKKFSVNNFNYSRGLINGEGHPIINSRLGGYIDHMKGNRKETGRSMQSDLTVRRSEKYWLYNTDYESRK